MQRVFCALVLLKIVACNVNESIWTDPMTNTSLKTFEGYFFLHKKLFFYLSQSFSKIICI